MFPPFVPTSQRDAADQVERANSRIRELHERGGHKEALQLSIQTVEFAEEQLGNTHWLFAISLGNLAVELKWLGRIEEAREAYKGLLSWHESAPRGNEYFYAGTLSNFAELCVECGDEITAESLHTRALGIIESILPPDHPSLADYLSNLAMVRARTGRLLSAEQLLTRAVYIDSRSAETEVYVCALHLANLAHVKHALGEHADAVRSLRQAQCVIREKLGGVHSLTADTLCKIASIYRTIEDFSEAEALYKEALRIQLASLGRTQHAARTLESLASLYIEKNSRKEAENALSEAATIRAEIGQVRPNTSGLLDQARLRSSMGDLEAAESLFRQAKSDIEASRGPDDPMLPSTLNNLGEVLKSRGNVREAEGLYRRALEIHERSSGSSHPDRASILHNLAMLYAATGRVEASLNHMLEAEVVREREIGQVFSIGSERQRLRYLDSIVDFSSCLLSLVSEHLPLDAKAVRGAFELVLRRKGMTADAMTSQLAAILQAGTWDSSRNCMI